MEFRSVFISNPAQLSVRKGQLIVRQDKEITIPMEDVSSLLIESRAVTVTAAALQELADHGVTAYICDVSHMSIPEFAVEWTLYRYTKTGFTKRCPLAGLCECW